jgi:tetratricopeptide (TPR) repeat protein
VTRFVWPRFFGITAAIAVSLVLAEAKPARAAGLVGQPAPPAGTIATINRAIADITGTGDLGRARPALYLAVEAQATADLTDYLASLLRDDVIYNGLAATFEEAVQSKRGDEQRFARYNLARLHLLRARQLVQTRVSGGPREALATAAAQARKLIDDPNAARDPGALELLGDVLSEQDRPDEAARVYERIAFTSRPSATAHAQLKIGQAYQKASRLELAEAAYRRGIGVASSGGEALHNLHQSLASVYVRRGDFRAAAASLERSARVPTDAGGASFRPRTDVARVLLDRGYAREARAYAAAALRLFPGDEALRRLERDAAARVRPGR